jgi:hypothetical protein
VIGKMTTKKDLIELEKLAKKFIIGYKGWSEEQLEYLEKIDIHRKNIINLERKIRDENSFITFYRDKIFSSKVKG